MTATRPSLTALAKGWCALSLLAQTRPINETALREALDTAATHPELTHRSARWRG